MCPTTSFWTLRGSSFSEFFNRDCRHADWHVYFWRLRWNLVMYLHFTLGRSISCSTFTSISTSWELAHLPKHSFIPVSFHTSISVHQSKVMGYYVISPSSIYTFYPIGVFWISDFEYLHLYAEISWMTDSRLCTKFIYTPMYTSVLQFESNSIQYLLCTYLLTATCHTRLGVEFSVCVIMLAFRCSD